MARGDPSGPTVPADTYYTLLQASIEQIVSLKYAQLLYNVQSMKLHRSTKPNASPIAYKSLYRPYFVAQKERLRKNAQIKSVLNYM